MLNPLSWFTFQYANVEGFFGKILLVVFLAFCFFGVVCRIVTIHRTKDRYTKWMGKRLAVLLFTMGFLGIVLYFFSYEQIRFFGGRFWYPLWGIGTVVWAAFLIKFFVKDIPRIRDQQAKEHAKMKYFPGRR